MLIYIIFAVLLLFVFACYFSFEYCRYKTVGLLAEALGWIAVFKPGGSYMSRNHGGAEERAWIVPDDRMAWGSILSVLRPPAGILRLLKKETANHGFISQKRAD